MANIVRIAKSIRIAEFARIANLIRIRPSGYSINVLLTSLVIRLTVMAMRALSAELVVLGITLIAITTTAQADDDDQASAWSRWTRVSPRAPSVVVAVPDALTTRVLSPAAFSALDDNGARPIGRRAPRPSPARRGARDRYRRRRALGGGRRTSKRPRSSCSVTSTEPVSSASTPAPPARSNRPRPIGSANFSYLADLRPRGTRHFAAGLLGALAHFRPDPATSSGAHRDERGRRGPDDARPRRACSPRTSRPVTCRSSGWRWTDETPPLVEDARRVGPARHA